MMSRKTIFALATPPGKSGVAMIRLSGPQSLSALAALTAKRDWEPNMARFCVLASPASGEIIDRVLAIFFKGPASFTGEDVAELHTHGSLAVIRELLAVLGNMDGLRPAGPGEFSRRAFLNGKMDLVEAEGLADLIDAETGGQKSQALRQMGGDISAYYQTLRERIVTALAHLEAVIDFPDEEIPPSVLANVKLELDGIRATIAAALSDHRRGEKVREGIQIVILGAPNAGKSSLLNALARRDAAIVSHRAGTTRDVIDVHLNLAGYPVILSDTAGIRQSRDDIEEEGVKRALARAETADIKLLLFDGESPKPDPQTLKLISDNVIQIISKSDIMISENLISRFNNQKYILISSKTGKGIESLLGEIESRIVEFFSPQATPMITRGRHRALLNDALAHIDRIRLDNPLELACEELRLAAGTVGKITGKITVDELLDVVFKSFCIGK